MTPPCAELVVSSFPNAKALPLWIASDLGLFERSGLWVRIDKTENSARQREDLQNGCVQIAQAAVDNALELIACGVDVVIVMGGESGMNEFIVRPEIKRFEDFTGYTLAVDSPHTAYALQAKRLLSRYGLAAGRDYQVEAVGNSGSRYAALQKSADYGGCVLNPPYSSQARAQGFGSLGRLVDLLGPYQAGGAFTLRRFAMENPDALEAYMAAYVLALRWLRSPANHRAANQILQRELDLGASTAAAALMDLLDPQSGFVSDAKLDLEGLRNVLATREETVGLNARLADMNAFVDERWHKRALARLG